MVTKISKFCELKSHVKCNFTAVNRQLYPFFLLNSIMIHAHQVPNTKNKK
jgi:hypothetical protein